MVEVLLNIQMKMTWIIMNGAAIMIKNIIIRAETRTPGLTRKSNSTLSLVNDVDMEVPDLMLPDADAELGRGDFEIFCEKFRPFGIWQR